MNSFPGADEQLPLPLAHQDRLDGVVNADVLDRLAARDRPHDDHGLELEAVGAALAHRWGPTLRGGAPPKRLTMGAVQKSQTTSGLRASLATNSWISHSITGKPVDHLWDAPPSYVNILLNH